MTRLKVNPTRMEMRNLQHRLGIAQRGHRLLKEKQDSMIRAFMDFSEDARILRKQVEDQFVRVDGAYQRASLMGEDRLIQKTLMSNEHSATLDVKRDFVLGLRVPVYEAEFEYSRNDNLSLLALHRDIDRIQDEYITLFPRLIELAQIEKKCMMLANEIKETRRRVNALEHRTIPNIKETIAFIAMRIEDNERSQKARVMKVNKK